MIWPFIAYLYFLASIATAYACYRAFCMSAACIEEGRPIAGVIGFIVSGYLIHSYITGVF